MRLTQDGFLKAVSSPRGRRLLKPMRAGATDEDLRASCRARRRSRKSGIHVRRHEQVDAAAPCAQHERDRRLIPGARRDPDDLGSLLSRRAGRQGRAGRRGKRWPVCSPAPWSWSRRSFPTNGTTSPGISSGSRTREPRTSPHDGGTGLSHARRHASGDPRRPRLRKCRVSRKSCGRRRVLPFRPRFCRARSRPCAAGTLIVNLPGSPRGAVECLEAVASVLGHAVTTLRGEAGDDHPGSRAERR